MEDTINVIEVIPGGPSEKVGIANGDKIISVNGKNFTGVKINPNSVKEQLRGPKNSTVKLGIKRQTSDKILYFTIKRGHIPIKSVDAAYMIEKNTGCESEPVWSHHLRRVCNSLVDAEKRWS